MLAIEDNAYTQRVANLGRSLPIPRGIVLFSAHYEAARVMVSEVQHYPMIYDFGGFPDALYTIQYPAMGDIALSHQVEHLLRQGHIPFGVESQRGLDHGAWVVLRLLYPDGEVPVVAMSVTPGLAPEQQYHVGQVLESLRQEGVLIIGSGGTVHNLRAVMWDSDAVAEWALSFDEWLQKTLEGWDLTALFQYRAIAPGAALAVPAQGDEHFIPLLYAMGAADSTRKAELVHKSYRYGSLSHSIWLFR